MLLAKMRVPSKIRRGTRIPVIADLRWAACTPTQCVPLKARLTLNLTAGTDAAGINADLSTPRRPKSRASRPTAPSVRGKKTVRLGLPAGLSWTPATRYFSLTTARPSTPLAKRLRPARVA